MCWERTPLHQAVRNNHAEVVRILVDNGADVNAKDERLITPLLLAGSAVNRDDHEEMTKFVETIRILVLAKAFLNTAHPDTGISRSIIIYIRDYREARRGIVAVCIRPHDSSSVRIIFRHCIHIYIYIYPCALFFPQWRNVRLREPKILLKRSFPLLKRWPYLKISIRAGCPETQTWLSI